MDPVTIAMLGMGGLNMIQNQENAARDRTLQAAKMRYSPWTGLKGKDPQVANPMGDLAQAGAGALGYEQNKKLMAAIDKMVGAQGAAAGGQGPWSRIRGYQAVSLDPASQTASPLSELGDYNEAGPYAMARARGLA